MSSPQNSRPEVPIRDAATIMLVRDGETGLEVFMVQRTVKTEFVAGAHVFPGGAVDADDYHKDLEAICVGKTDAEISKRLGMNKHGLALLVAAIRESFEESGFLLAEDAAGNAIRFEEPGITGRFIEHRRKIHQGEEVFSNICQQENLRLPVRQGGFFFHLLAPSGAPRRYDTRFFVAAAPGGQTPLHDGRETIDSCWINPGDALEKSKQGEFKLVTATIKNLQQLSQYETVAALMRSAPDRQVQRILPKVIYGEDGKPSKVVFPDDADYAAIRTPDDD